MIKNRYYFLLLFLILQTSLFAQKRDRGFLKAQELLDAKKYYESLYEFKSVKTYDDFEENFKNEQIAFIYSKLNNYEQALSFLLQMKNAENQDYLLGITHFENDSISKSISFLEKTIQKEPENAKAFSYLGKAYFKNKDYVNAQISIEKALEYGYEEVLIEKSLGICYYFSEDYLKSITSLEYVKKYFPYDKELNKYLGMGYFKVARKDLAVSTLRKGIDVNDKSSAETAVNLSLVFDDLEEPDSAIHFLKLAIKIDPERVDAYYFLGSKFYDLKKYNQSRFYYEKLLEINPNYDKAYAPLANTYFLDNLYEKAIEKYKKSTFLDENPAEELNYIGICYLQMNNIPLAKAYFEEALIKDPSFFVSYLNLANLSFQEKRYNSALSYLNYATQYSKNNPDIYFLYAKIYLQQKNTVDATHYFRETIRFNSLKKQAYLYLGHLSLLENKPREANFFYDILLTFEPNHEEGNLYRGIASYLTEEYDNSVRYLTVAEKLNPTDYKVKYQLSKALVKQKDYITAYVKLTDLNEVDPSDKRIYYLLYETCKVLKIKEEAQQHKATIKAFLKL